MDSGKSLMKGERNFVWSDEGVDSNNYQGSHWAKSIAGVVIGRSFIVNTEFHGMENLWLILVNCDSLVVDGQKIKYYLVGHHSYY